MMFEVTKYSKHSIKVTLPWYGIVPTHVRHIKVGIKPSKSD